MAMIQVSVFDKNRKTMFLPKLMQRLLTHAFSPSNPTTVSPLTNAEIHRIKETPSLKFIGSYETSSKEISSFSLSNYSRLAGCSSLMWNTIFEATHSQKR